MIEHFPALLLVGMAWNNKNQPEEKTEWKPSKFDAENIKRGMEGFATETIGKHKIYPFHLYLESKGIVSITREGMYAGTISVRSPLEYRRAQDAYGLLDWIKEKDLEQVFAAMPEEKAIYDSKIAAMIKEIGEFMRTKKVANPN